MLLACLLQCLCISHSNNKGTNIFLDVVALFTLQAKTILKPCMQIYFYYHTYPHCHKRSFIIQTSS